MIWLCALFASAAAVLGIKLHSVRKAARELREELSEKLASDTNTLLSVSTGDKEIRALAADLNGQLRLLRDQRRTFLHGDRELKEAVTNISHDLRTPLTAICGYLELLRREELSQSGARYVSFIENRTEAMKQLTEELFRYSVIVAAPELTLEPVNVGSVLEESLTGFYAALSGRGIVPDIRMPQGEVIRNLNRDALARVFSNILNNCLKYSSGDLEVTLEDSGDISFSNTAPELSQVQVARLFDRFYTVETGRSSTGLGLAISKTLLEQMGGSIAAHWQEGRFTVCVRLPNAFPA